MKICVFSSEVEILWIFLWQRSAGLGGSLLSFLRKHGSHHTIKTLVKICEDVAAGMTYLASMNCIHR